MADYDPPDSNPSVPAPTPPTASPPPPTQRSKASTTSHGPSLLEQVISKTRPPHLPPKEKSEDLKHLSVWQSMMSESQALESSRTSSERDRQIQLEIQLETRIHTWERQILPDWKVVYREPQLRKLWWQGVPPKWRGRLWANAIGNPLTLGKDSYRVYLARAKRALVDGAVSSERLTAIENDIATTLPSLGLFLPETGPLHDELKDLLLAWSISRRDDSNNDYVPGTARVAGMLLLNMNNSEQAFISLRNYLERSCPHAFFGGKSTKDEVEAYYRIFDTLLADYMPKVYFNFKQHQISPSVYLPNWFIPVFLDHLPFEVCARLWDIVLLEGDSFLFRIAIAILGALESRLFFPETAELLQVLSGEHKAAREVAIRNGIDISNGKYSIFGFGEEALWERLNELEKWWKDTTWTRLLQRELPDL